MKGPYTPRRRCLATAIVAAFKPRSSAAAFRAALGAGYLGGRGIGRAIAGRVDRHT